MLAQNSKFIESPWSRGNDQQHSRKDEILKTEAINIEGVVVVVVIIELLSKVIRSFLWYKKKFSNAIVVVELITLSWILLRTFGNAYSIAV